MRPILAAACICLLAVPLAAQEAVTIAPDPVRTPGAFNPDETADTLCHKRAKSDRRPSTKICDVVFAAYGIDPKHRYEYECDHLIPVALGGLTRAENLWPQPNPEAERKDKLERKLKRLVCRRKNPIPLADAQRDIAANWIAAYAKYVKR